MKDKSWYRSRIDVNEPEKTSFEIKAVQFTTWVWSLNRFLKYILFDICILYSCVKLNKITLNVKQVAEQTEHQNLPVCAPNSKICKNLMQIH